MTARRTSTDAADEAESGPHRVYRITEMTLIGAFLILQFLIPARLVIGGMGAVGRPSVAVGILLAFLWVVSLLRAQSEPRRVKPIRILIGLWLAVQLVGYAIGADRRPPSIELLSGDRWVILMVAMAGLTLAVAEGVRSRRDLDRLLMLLVALTTVMAAVGALQYLRVVDLTEYIRVPGLSPNRELLQTGSRGETDIARVAGTANHYIEFGVVLAMVLPIALHLAFFAGARQRSKALAWAQAGLIAAAIPMSISRSAILAMAVSTIVMFAVWQWRLRYNAAVIGLVCLMGFHVLTRGLLGTILSLFENVDNDPSIQNRISDQAMVRELWSEYPWFGRGAGMIIPDRYLLLDNQFFVILIASGIVGVLIFGALYLVPYFLARSVRLRASDEADRHLGQALAAALLAGMLTAATFDALSFATYTGLLFFLLGVTGALWRLTGVSANDPRPGLAWSPEDRVMGPPLMLPDHPRRAALAALATRTDTPGIHDKAGTAR